MTTLLSLRRCGSSFVLARLARRALLAVLGVCMVLAASPVAAQFALPFPSTSGTRASVFLTATTQPAAIPPVATTPVITLHWATSTSATGYLIYRRQFRDPPAPWVKIDELKGDATAFADGGRAAPTTTAPFLPAYGAAVNYALYEYQVIRTAALGAADMDMVAYGYICTGYQVSSRDSRGTVVLIAERNVAATLDTQLTTWTNDLISCGWQVIRHEVDITDNPIDIRARIKADYDADPAHVSTVFLFGQVPYYTSGTDNWDNTGSKSWPSDAYYGDMADTDWGPGCTDLPNRITLQVGRVDLSNLPAFPQSESFLLGQYLDKVHAYRLRGYEATLGSCIDKVGSNASQNFWRHVAQIVPGAYTPSIWNPCGCTLLGYIGGSSSSSPGNPPQDHIDGVIKASDLAVTTSILEPGVINMFYNLEGVGQWNTTNNLMRAALATPRTGLASIWVGRPNWYLHPLAMGETLGICTRLTQNNPTNGSQYQPVNALTGKVHTTLLGDPTLYIYPVKPATNLKVSYIGSSAHLSWDASTNRDPIWGYAVYRSTSPNGPFGDAERLNHTMTQGALTYDDPLPSNRSFIYYYNVRAVAYITTPSGSYHANSLGTAPVKLDRGVTLTADLPSPRLVGNTITLKATTPDTVASGTFTITRNGVDEVFSGTIAGSTATLVWIPTDSGVYTITATINTTNSGTMTSNTLSYTINEELSDVTLDVTPIQSVAGADVLVTATATGGANDLYQFVCDGTVVQDYSDVSTYTWTPTAPGDYDWTVNVKDALGADPTLVYTLLTPVTATVCAPLLTVALDASPSSARMTNTPITLTAQTDGGGGLEYQFLVDGNVLRDYDPSPICTWTPVTDGIFTLQVNARDLQGGALTQAATSPPLTFRITLPLNSVTLQSDSPANCRPGTKINLSAYATGGANLSYEFFEDGVALPVLDAASSHYVWTQAGLGPYKLTVRASDLNSDDPTAFVESDPPLVLRTLAPLTGVTLTMSPTTSCPVRGQVTLQATATGGQQVAYQFKANDTVIQDYSDANSCTWAPMLPGKFYLTVWAKETNVTAPKTTFSSNVCPLKVVPALSAVTFKASPEAKSVVNSPVVITATATGGDAVEYKFMHILIDDAGQVVYDGGWPTLVTLRDYNASPTFTWKPTKAGRYPLFVVVHDLHAADPLEEFQSVYMEYVIVPALTGVAISDIYPQAPATVGSTITIQAVATGGTHVLYQFLAGSTVIRDFALSSTCVWKPTSTGTIKLTVRAKESAASPANPVLISAPVSYLINTALSSVSLKFSGPAVVGSPVTLTATPVGGARMMYRFQQGVNILRLDDPSPSFTWVPSQAGVQNISVVASDLGGANTPYKRSATSAIQTDVAPLIGLLPNFASPQRLNTAITLTANALGLVNPSFTFSVASPIAGGRWGAYKALPATKGITAIGVILWKPTAAGQYRLRVTVRGLASGKTREYTQDLVYTVVK